MHNQVSTRQFIISLIDSLLPGEVSVPAFDEKMVAYFAFKDKYKLESCFEGLLEEVIGEFMTCTMQEKALLDINLTSPLVRD